MTASNNNALYIWRNYALLVTTLCCIYASFVQVAGVDFWLQAKIGEIIFDSHEIPDTLLFPFTEVASQHFNAHEWLSSLLFHVLLLSVGTENLPFIHAALGLLLFVFATSLGWVCSRGNWATSLFGGLLAVTVENYRHVLRPELIATLLLICYWIALEKLRQRIRPQYTFYIILIQVIWVNTHGSFILGPLLAGVYAAGNHLDSIRHSQAEVFRPNRLSLVLAGIAFSSLGACLINPFGDEMLRFVIGFSNDPTLSVLIGEWMPTFSKRWVNERGWWIALIVWIACVVWICIHRQKLSAVDVLVFLLFTALAYKAIRFPVYLGIVAAYLLTRLQPEVWKLPHFQLAITKIMAITSSILIILVVLYGNAYGVKPYSYGLYRLGPELEAALEDDSHHGNVLNSMELGAELIYRAHPRLRPTIDCRVDSYGMDYYRYTMSLINSRELLQEFVKRYQVKYMLYETPRVLDAVRRGTFDATQWKILAQDKRFLFMQYEPSSENVN
ncbi:hypothetical protein [Rhodoferax sp. TH121]|uniref:hypothetical protein n=1 Tax=Rhodoferax sp. TH121 TaxID=2022803 RepID=UPI0011407215|nr:hypothetical protein [Rhodoferax sp. TH121]